MNPIQGEIDKLNAEFEAQAPEAILAWVWKRYGRKAAFASSFGAEDVVLIDLAAKTSKDVRIFTLDTGRLPEETYQVIEEIRRKYGVSIEVFFPEAGAVERLVGAKGLYSFRESVENRKECCRIRKVEPLGRALRGAEAWVTGLRREQSATRTDLKIFESDATQGGLLKVSPIAGWTEAQVWEYIRKNNVPYNRLHDAGYPSIGCAPCTRAVKEGEDVRAGRWWWELPEHKECGLHPGSKRPPEASREPKKS